MLEELLAQTQQLLFEALVQPLMFGLGAGNLLPDAYDGLGWVLGGLIQILIVALVLFPLQRLWPAEPVGPARTAWRQAVRVDLVYTLLQRLGVVRLGLFLALGDLWNGLFGWLAVHGVDGWHLDQWVAPWWPGVTDTAVAGFLVYLVAFDFLMYWIHRGQHQFSAWWALHALHHSQRHLNPFTDSRNHLLDDLVVDVLFVVTARIVGVPPGQFMALVLLSQALENLSHANLRWSFGPVGRYLLVSPLYHRLHHAIGLGHESGPQRRLGGHNFAVLLPIWDLLFGTVRFTRGVEPTGIRDQLPEEGGRDYGEGFWRQQWLGLKRLCGRA
ncbi:sterol desaturase family protein [Ideonella livida]|uniref:Sterol desaturase family protein n=1 Tax=Ideonella livida TaxID=2707176 RepID=A0A7C9PFF7_9BURK|nr:sterol desaturase family protein [Ideonella livida]NDY90573.1 sterol desaturase family protein [Ideonella livida]